MRTERPLTASALVRALGVIALSATASLTACTAGGAASAPTPATVASVCAEDIVVECVESPGSVAVTVSAAASDEAVLALAEQLRLAAAAAALDEGATLLRAPEETPRLDAEVALPPAWTVSVYPGDAAGAARALGGMLEVEDVPGTTGISMSDGWPTVTVQEMADFEWVFTTVKDLPLFADGGTYTLLSASERLRVVHIPAMVSDAAVHEVVDIAQQYPDAEVLLEADPADPAPVLYVAGLTADEVAALDRRLTDPALAQASVPGYPLPFVLRFLTADGLEYAAGTLGGVAPAG